MSVVGAFGTNRGVNWRSAGLVFICVLGGEPAMLQAPMFDGLSLDPFALFDDGWGPDEVAISGRYVVQALVVSAMVLVLDKGLDLRLEVARQEVVFPAG